MIRFRLAPGVVNVPIATGQLILHSPASGRVVLLEPWAREAWLRLTEQWSIADVAAALSRDLGSDAGEEFRRVEELADKLVGERLLDQVPLSATTPRPSGDGESERARVLLSWRGEALLLAVDSAEIVAAIEQRFGHFLIDAGDAPAPVAWISVNRRDGEFIVELDGETAGWTTSLGSCIERIERLAQELLVERHQDLIWLHAGAAAWNERATLVVGVRGRGKSGLVTGLTARGWQYLSDEVVPLSCPDHHALPYPLTPIVREASDRWLSPPEFAQLPRSYVPVAPSSVRRSSAEVGSLVFPEYRPDAGCELRACSAGQATLLLMENCHAFARRQEATLRDLSALAQRVPCFRLFYPAAVEGAEYISRAVVNWYL